MLDFECRYAKLPLLTSSYGVGRKLPATAPNNNSVGSLRLIGLRFYITNKKVRRENRQKKETVLSRYILRTKLSLKNLRDSIELLKKSEVSTRNICFFS